MWQMNFTVHSNKMIKLYFTNMLQLTSRDYLKELLMPEEILLDARAKKPDLTLSCEEQKDSLDIKNGKKAT